MLTELVAFVPVAAVVICTPGPDRAHHPQRACCLDALTGCVLIGLGVRLAAGQH